MGGGERYLWGENCVLKGRLTSKQGVGKMLHAGSYPLGGALGVCPPGNLDDLKLLLGLQKLEISYKTSFCNNYKKTKVESKSPVSRTCLFSF